MKIIVVGLGVQGNKRSHIAKNDLVATVDPKNSNANYKYLKNVPLESYDTVCLCVPDDLKLSLINYCIDNKKNIIIEKPLKFSDPNIFKSIEKKANENKIVIYTAYNHRFEPHFIKMKKYLDTNIIGKVYSCRIFYGNGTAKLFKESPWRDKGDGVLSDIGSHLIDLCFFWFPKNDLNFKAIRLMKNENKSFDHVIIGSKNISPYIELEMSLCMWKNYFSCDIIGEKGSLHIQNLCKWGPSTITYRKRKLPSGKPVEKKYIIRRKDPTWKLEYFHFKKLVSKKLKVNLNKDMKIQKILDNIL